VTGARRFSILNLAVAAGLWVLTPAVPRAEEVRADATVPAEPAPRVYYTSAGQFEIVALDDASAQQALALGRSVWRSLAAPLGIATGGFSSPVSIRLVPEKQWTEPAVFLATVEPPGRVMVRVRWSDDVDPLIVRRAFVQGLILRQAVAWHGVVQGINAPLWLEQAALLWSLAHERPAMMDAFRQESRGVVALPSVPELLNWERGTMESRGWELSALWFFLQLQEDARDGGSVRWQTWLKAVLKGDNPYAALPRSYPGLWADGPGLELWWRMAFFHQSRLNELPVLNADESRAWLAHHIRWLAGRDGREVVLGLDELRDLRREPWVRVRLIKEMDQARAILGVIHPYYANVAISLGRVYEQALKGSKEDFEKAIVGFNRDAIDARELEDEVGAMLDTAPKK
jgi:hypothetical protein